MDSLKASDMDDRIILAANLHHIGSSGHMLGWFLVKKGYHRVPHWDHCCFPLIRVQVKVYSLVSTSVFCFQDYSIFLHCKSSVIVAVLLTSPFFLTFNCTSTNFALWSSSVRQLHPNVTPDRCISTTSSSKHYVWSFASFSSSLILDLVGVIILVRISCEIQENMWL